VVKSFSFPKSSYGLTFDGTYLWVSAFDSDTSQYRLYKLTTSGQIVNSFYFENDRLFGLAFDGTYLWSVGKKADTNLNMLYKINTSGKIVSSVGISNLPAALGDITFDGTYLWVAIQYSGIIFEQLGTVYKITTSGQILDVFTPPDPNPYGLTFDGTYLWISGRNNHNIYKVKPEMYLWVK